MSYNSVTFRVNFNIRPDRPLPSPGVFVAYEYFVTDGRISVRWDPLLPIIQRQNVLLNPPPPLVVHNEFCMSPPPSRIFFEIVFVVRSEVFMRLKEKVVRSQRVWVGWVGTHSRKWTSIHQGRHFGEHGYKNFVRNRAFVHSSLNGPFARLHQTLANAAKMLCCRRGEMPLCSRFDQFLRQTSRVRNEIVERLA